MSKDKNPFVRVYEDEEDRSSNVVFWVNLNTVNSIDIARDDLIFLDIEHIFLKGCFLVVKEDNAKVKNYLGIPEAKK